MNISDAKNKVDVKEVFVLRLSKSSNYLQEVAWVGTFFQQIETKSEQKNEKWVIVRDMLNGKRPSLMCDENVILYFGSEKEAKEALCKIFASYSKENKKELPKNLIEIVSIQVSISENIVAQYSSEEILQEGESNNELFDEFEEGLMKTPFAQKLSLTKEELKSIRGLNEYKDVKIDGFFKSWIELNK